MESRPEWRAGAFGARPVRIANCSGWHGDPAVEMYKQATLGEVDFITGDYLAEVNIANNAESYDTLDTSPRPWPGSSSPSTPLPRKASRGYDLKVSYVSGDNVLPRVGKYMPQDKSEVLPHLDSTNPRVTLRSSEAFTFAKEGVDPREIVSANAYLGAHAICEAFQHGADIIICGRVSDASPVIACAWYWWSWSRTDYDALAGALIAGHLIECSAYVTGGNFAGFDAFDVETFVDPGFPIAEVAKDGTCVITKHEGTGGMVTVDTCKAQLVYELQGNVYLNSDVKAYLDDIEMEQVGENRVHVHGVRGAPPPETTKLAVFYKGGYENQVLLNATGNNVEKKFDLFEKQLRFQLGDAAIEALDVLDLQRIGVPAVNPRNQNSSTVYLRVFAQSTKIEAVNAIMKALGNISLRHFSGFHSSLDFRSALPRPYLAYYPALWNQSDLEERFHVVNADGMTHSFETTPPTRFEALGERESYDTTDPVTFTGEFRALPLGDIALGRSGDKGANLNFGLFVDSEAKWHWLRSYLSRAKVQELLADEWQPEFTVERVEFPHIFAVHFVVYGILGRGVSSAKRLDGFGKGFVDYFRAKIVQVPVSILEG